MGISTASRTTPATQATITTVQSRRLRARPARTPESSGVGWFWYAVVFVVLAVWASYNARDEMRKAKPKLELRQRRLRELLATLEARE